MAKCSKVFWTLSYGKNITAPLLSVGFWLKLSFRSSSHTALQPGTKSLGAKIVRLGRSYRHIWPWVHLWSLSSKVMRTHLSFPCVIGEAVNRRNKNINQRRKAKEISHSILWWVKHRYNSNQISVTDHKIFLRFNFHTSNKNNSPSIAHSKYTKHDFLFFSCFGQNKRNPYKIVYENTYIGVRHSAKLKRQH